MQHWSTVGSRTPRTAGCVLCKIASAYRSYFFGSLVLLNRYHFTTVIFIISILHISVGYIRCSPVDYLLCGQRSPEFEHFSSRAKMAHAKQPRPDSGLGFEVNALTTFQHFPSWLGSGLPKI